jgi:tRNA pseudouridine55 synthase
VLLIGVGHGTRVLQYLQSLPKVYRARLRFGCRTDTQDVTGVALAEADASAITEAQFRAEVLRFQGDLLQTPPMVSALKSGGRRLYELARRGETVHREPRQITVHVIEPLAFFPGVGAEGEFRVTCSAGTYVRTICHDLGEILGVGAMMTALEREAVGHFVSASGVRLESLTPSSPLLPLAEALGHLPAVQVDGDETRRLAHGQFIQAPADTPDGPIRLLAGDGTLLAIGSVHGHGEARLIAPDKVFNTAEPASGEMDAAAARA